MSNRELIDDIVEKARELMPAPKPSSNLGFIFAISIIFLAMIIGGINFTSPHHNTVITNINHAEKPIRQWNELPLEERRAIKEEALRKFPYIADIGKGTNWKEVSEWMIEEKSVVVSNTRDLFR